MVSVHLFCYRLVRKKLTRCNSVQYHRSGPGILGPQLRRVQLERQLAMGLRADDRQAELQHTLRFLDPPPEILWESLIEKRASV